MSEVDFKDIFAEPLWPVVAYATRTNKYDMYWMKGGRGSTKSSCVTLLILLGMMADPTANALACRKVGDTIRGSVHQSFLWGIDTLQVNDFWDYTTSPAEFTYKPTGQKIIMKGADKPEKLKGLNLAKGYFKYNWFEEAAEFAGMHEIRNILQTTLRGGEIYQSFITYNPPDDINNWVNLEAEKNIPGRYVHHSDYTGVPREWLGEQFIKDAEILQEIDPDRYRHEYMGEVVGRTDKVVFNGKWEEKEFTADPNWETYHGADWGFSNDPNVAVRCHVDWDGDYRDLYIEYAEFGYKTEMDHLPALFRRVPDIERYVIEADSARPETISYMKRHGFPRMRSVRKWTGSDEDGVEWMRGFRRIYIHPRCEDVIEEFKAYSYKVNKAGDVEPKLEDKNNHGIDAIRYALSRLIRKRDTNLSAIGPVTTGTSHDLHHVDIDQGAAAQSVGNPLGEVVF